MSKMKQFLAVVLMALVLGVGAPAAYADGPSETPGFAASAGPSETPGMDEGPSETPGRLMVEIMMYLATNFAA